MDTKLCHTDSEPTKLFRVKRLFVTVIAAEKPFQALEMVRENPELWDTDIIESVDLVTDEAAP